MRRSQFFFALLAIFFAWGEAVACPDGYYNTPLGICLPNSGTVIDGATRPFTESAAVAAGALLEQWINQSRNSAIGSSSPIPPMIRYQLEPYFDADVLNRARWKVGDNGFFNAARNIQFNRDVAGVTLNDLIVFSSAADSQNLATWAHELRHVQQFRDWGTRDFAIRYVRNFNAVENEAYAMQNRVAASPRRPPPYSPFPSGGSNPFPPPPPIPVRFCRTPPVTCSIPPTMAPMGTPCHCPGPYGSWFMGNAF